MKDEPETPGGGGRWYLQVELWLLVMLVLGIHFTRLDAVMLHGEETRRANVAVEMLRSGDWVVPNLQGDVFFTSNRPPMQQWLIATLGILRGGADPVAVRLPSVLAVLLTTLLIFAYGRLFLSRAGAFAAAAAFPTFGEVLEMGHLAETDALFTLFVSGSMLLWHIGFARRWAPTLTWGIAYACVALAALTKGPQGPVYFACAVGLHLLVTRQWRFAISWAHAFGIGVFCLLWGGWVVPFSLRAGLEAVRHVYFGDVFRYGNAESFGHLGRHLVDYPFRLFGCLLPWSLLLAGYLRRDLRRAIGDARPPLVFCLGAILITVPSVWWVVDAESRFFIPLYPCFAVLVGIVFQRSVDPPEGAGLKTIWKWFAVALSILVPLTGAAVATASFVDGVLDSIAQPPWFAITNLILMLALGALLWWSRGTVGWSQQVVAIASVAAFGGLVFSGIVKNCDLARATNKAVQVARARALVPDGATLYSLGEVGHGFAYYYGEPIVRTPQPEGELPEHVEYFVFREPYNGTLNFAWEPLSFVDPAITGRKDRPLLVVVARKVPGEPDPRPLFDLVSERYAAMQAERAAPGQPPL